MEVELESMQDDPNLIQTALLLNHRKQSNHIASLEELSIESNSVNIQTNGRIEVTTPPLKQSISSKTKMNPCFHRFLSRKTRTSLLIFPFFLYFIFLLHSAPIQSPWDHLLEVNSPVSPQRIWEPRKITFPMDPSEKGKIPLDPYLWMTNSSHINSLETYILQEELYRKQVLQPLQAIQQIIAERLALEEHKLEQGKIIGPLKQWEYGEWHYAEISTGMYVRAKTRLELLRETTVWLNITQILVSISGMKPAILSQESSDSLDFNTSSESTYKSKWNRENSKTVLDIGIFETTESGNRVAFSVNFQGNERFELYTWDADNRQLCYPFPISNQGYYSARFVGDDWLYFNVVDDLGVPKGIVRANLAECGQIETNLILEKVYWEPYPELTPVVTLSSDSQYVIIERIGQGTKSQLINHQLTHSRLPFMAINLPQKGILHEVDHAHSAFYFRTNLKQESFELIQIPDDNIELSGILNQFKKLIHLNETKDIPRQVSLMEKRFQGFFNQQLHVSPSILPAQDGTLIEKVECIASYLVVWVRKYGFRLVKWSNLNKNLSSKLFQWEDGPHWNQLGKAYSVVPSCAVDMDNRIYRSNHNPKLTFTNSSFINQPAQLWELDLDTQKQRQVGGIRMVWNRTDLHLERLWVAKNLSVTRKPPLSYFQQEKYHQDVYVPVDIAYKRPEPFDFNSNPLKFPVLFMTYGAYGSITEVAYDSDLRVLLEANIMLAWVHPRGDGDLGPLWYRYGSQLYKKNTFEDVKQVMWGLIHQKIIDSSRIAVKVRSAGGTLILDLIFFSLRRIMKYISLE